METASTIYILFPYRRNTGGVRMKENLKKLFKSENLKAFSKKIFTKKKVGAAIAIIVLLTAARIGFSLMFEIKGTVLKVDTNSIVVTNFLGTKTVNTGSYPIDSNRIVVGQKIEISKNLSGDVTSIRMAGGRLGEDNNRPGGQLGRSGKFEQGQGQRQGKNGNGGSAEMPGNGAPDGTSGASQNQNGQGTLDEQSSNGKQ